MTPEEQAAEIARLHAFILQVAQRLFLAAEVIQKNAENKPLKDGRLHRIDEPDNGQTLSGSTQSAY